MNKLIVSFLFFVWMASAPSLSLAVAPEDYYNAGMDLMNKQHDYEKAIQYFRAAVDQRPDYWQGYQGLGEAYYQAANRTEAVVAIEQSLRLHPDNQKLREFLAMIKKNSPWVPQGGGVEYLSIISILLSLAALASTVYLTLQLRSRGDNASPKS